MLPGRNNYNKIRRLGASNKSFIYSAKSYNNPFFQKKNAQRLSSDNLSNKKKLFIIGLITTFLILIWLIFFSKLFKIYDIKVNGLDESGATAIMEEARNIARGGLIGNNNLLIFDKDELAESLNEKYYLSYLAIDKKFFHTLEITLHLKERTAVWLNEDKYYYLDDDGSLIAQVDPLNINRQSLPLIESPAPVKIEERQSVINKDSLAYVAGLFNEFKDNKHGFEIEKFIVGDSLNTVKLAVVGGPEIFFNTTQPIAGQAGELDLVIKEKLKDAFKAKEYIDLRFGNNVYVK